MNKLLIYIVALLSFCASAQAKRDTIAISSQKTDYQNTEGIGQSSFRDNFREDYKGEDFQYDTIIADKSSLWEQFKAWLSYWLDRIFSFGNEANVSAFEIVIKILAILVILFVVYLIVKAIINKEGKWIFGKSSKKKITARDAFEEDIHNIDFRSIIAKSKEANDYRLSIRYYYLWLLKKMTDNAIIEWDIEKTNSDYVHEIQKEALKEDFQYLSYIYDYSWYGEFLIDDSLFIKAEKAFVKTLNSI